MLDWFRPSKLLWNMVLFTRTIVDNHEERIKTLERKFNEMSERTDKLDAEISQLDVNEQKEEAEIADLKSRVSKLEDELAFAQNSGDDAAIDAATNKLHDVNARLSALLEAGAGTTTTITPTASETAPTETTLQVNIPPEDTNTVKG
jgi:predicted nuclease with TOPRIM domain